MFINHRSRRQRRMFGLQFRMGVCEIVVLLLSSAVHKVRFIIHCTTFIATHALLVITVCLSVSR